MAKGNLQRANHLQDKERKEFEEAVLQIDRVTRVVKGGRRLRFRVTVVIGDKRGRVGMGIGKAAEVSISVHKAVAQAKKALIRVPLTKNDSIPHMVQLKYKAARLMMFPALPGTGLIAGGALRKVLELAGVKNVMSKNYGTSNRVVTTQAAMLALQKLRPLRPKDQKGPEESRKPSYDKSGPSDKPKLRATRQNPSAKAAIAPEATAPVVEAPAATEAVVSTSVSEA